MSDPVTEARDCEMGQPMISLTKRLAAAALAVREACRVADVGCDHGKLTAYLILSGRCSLAYATDSSAPSLKKAESLFRSLGIEDRAKVVLCEGLSCVGSRDVDDVVIAGLGFDVIARTISDTPWLRNEEKRLVLVPSSHPERLRRFLCEGGFEILRECAVKDMGHIYTVITAAYCGKEREVTPVFAAFGRILDSGGDSKAYVEMVKRRNETLIGEMEGAKNRDTEKIRNAKEILRFIDRLPHTDSAECRGKR